MCIRDSDNADLTNGALLVVAVFTRHVVNQFDLDQRDGELVAPEKANPVQDDVSLSSIPTLDEPTIRRFAQIKIS